MTEVEIAEIQEELAGLEPALNSAAGFTEDQGSHWRFLMGLLEERRASL